MVFNFPLKQEELATPVLGPEDKMASLNKRWSCFYTAALPLKASVHRQMNTLDQHLMWCVLQLMDNPLPASWVYEKWYSQMILKGIYIVFVSRLFFLLSRLCEHDLTGRKYSTDVLWSCCFKGCCKMLPGAPSNIQLKNKYLDDVFFVAF